MSLPDRLSCPACQGRLASENTDRLACSICDREFAVLDGVADLVGDSMAAGDDRYGGVIGQDGFLSADLIGRIKNAAGILWPSSLGDAIELGCGDGVTTRAILKQEAVRTLLVVDSDPAVLRACRSQLAEQASTPPVWFAALGGGALATIRDAVADTVIGSVVLGGVGDISGFLMRVTEGLWPGGR